MILIKLKKIENYSEISLASITNKNDNTLDHSIFNSKNNTITKSDSYIENNNILKNDQSINKNSLLEDSLFEKKQNQNIESNFILILK